MVAAYKHWMISTQCDYNSAVNRKIRTLILNMHTKKSIGRMSYLNVIYFVVVNTQINKQAKNYKAPLPSCFKEGHKQLAQRDFVSDKMLLNHCFKSYYFVWKQKWLNGWKKARHLIINKVKCHQQVTGLWALMCRIHIPEANWWPLSLSFNCFTVTMPWLK